MATAVKQPQLYRSRSYPSSDAYTEARTFGEFILTYDNRDERPFEEIFKSAWMKLSLTDRADESFAAAVVTYKLPLNTKLNTVTSQLLKKPLSTIVPALAPSKIRNSVTAGQDLRTLHVTPQVKAAPILQKTKNSTIKVRKLLESKPVETTVLDTTQKPQSNNEELKKLYPLIAIGAALLFGVF